MAISINWGPFNGVWAPLMVWGAKRQISVLGTSVLGLSIHVANKIQLSKIKLSKIKTMGPENGPIIRNARKHAITP